MKTIIFLAIALLSSVAGATTPKDLFAQFDQLGMTSAGTVVGTKQVAFEHLTCHYVTLNTGSRDYACWYQVKSATASQNDAQMVADHAVGKQIYQMLQNLGYNEDNTASSGEISVRSLSCTQTTSNTNVVTASCTP